MSKGFHFLWLKPLTLFCILSDFSFRKILAYYLQSSIHIHKMHKVFSHLPSSISHFSVVASLVFTPLDGLQNENGLDIREAKICQMLTKKDIKTKGKAWRSTQSHPMNHRLWKRKLPFLIGFARPFSGIGCHFIPEKARANPKRVWST